MYGNKTNPVKIPIGPTGSTESVDQRPAIYVTVFTLLLLLVMIILYCLNEKKLLCWRRSSNYRSENDISGNEALITPVHHNKTNAALEISPDLSNGGLVSGLRAVPTRRSVPEKWYDSSALKFIDQSTDTLDQI